MLFLGALLLFETHWLHRGYATIVHNPAVRHVKALFGEQHVSHAFHSDGTSLVRNYATPFYSVFLLYRIFEPLAAIRNREKFRRSPK